MTNPFDTAVPQPAAEYPASQQPYAFGAMGALVMLQSLVVGNLLAALNHAEFSDYLLGNLMNLLPGWLCSLLLGGLAATLLVASHQERHAAVLVNPGKVLLAVAAAIVLTGLLYGALSGFLLAGLYGWLSEHRSLMGLYQPLVFEPLGLLAFALTNLLPLWLGLRLSAQKTCAPAPVGHTAVAALLALCVLLLSLKTVDILIKQVMPGYNAALPLALACLTPLLGAALVFASSWSALPARLQRLRAGQLLLTALAIFVVWMLAQLLVAGLLVIYALADRGSEVFHPVLLLIMGVGLLGLLWPLTLLGLRWIYRAEAAA
ncbi:MULTISPECIES: hypothetical protein [unclassified Pseudomonas]|uniref:hypothetical protein n=1 Tax=unclassified Pseudomonas TaxID=196821 RepID=UPI0024481FFB|nr:MULTISPECIES: hypothetical protein [unclassified Pseudomonas]MDG9923486.1 hypothetical protein [Pseudomonas sp. GD04045]MDH0035390.1 hypothetical protein [Pseudomonas sp. GD04019]